MRWQSTVLYGRAPPIMAKAARYRGETVTLPARLTARMRADWRKAAGEYVTDETMEEVWAALLKHAIRAKGDGASQDT